MSNINAAIGLSQLKRLDEFIARRRSVVHRYNQGLAGLPGLVLLDWRLDETAPFTYIVRVLDGRRDEAMTYLKELGIDTGVHYLPNHQQPYFASPHATSLPITEKVGTEILTLPLYSDLADEDVDRVIAGVQSFCRNIVPCRES